MFNFIRNIGIGEWVLIGIVILVVLSIRKDKKEEAKKEDPSDSTPKDNEEDNQSQDN